MKIWFRMEHQTFIKKYPNKDVKENKDILFAE
jgi:hypothetical protein